MKKFKLFFYRTSYKQFIELPDFARERVKKTLKEIEKNPFIHRSKADIKKLIINKKYPLYRARVGNYRIVFTVMGNEIKIIDILHRKKAYKFMQ